MNPIENPVIWLSVLCIILAIIAFVEDRARRSWKGVAIHAVERSLALVEGIRAARKRRYGPEPEEDPSGEETGP
jgi:hypothetical protein